MSLMASSRGAPGSDLRSSPGDARTPTLGQMWTEAICSSSPDEDHSEPLGIVTGAVAGDAALSSLGSTADERAVQRADERAARADAALRGFGIEPRTP
jgi:hypothetical protein